MFALLPYVSYLAPPVAMTVVHMGGVAPYKGLGLKILLKNF
jgi:hypothetical protein